jgi:hypothetical protein
MSEKVSIVSRIRIRALFSLRPPLEGECRPHHPLSSCLNIRPKIRGHTRQDSIWNAHRASLRVTSSPILRIRHASSGCHDELFEKNNMTIKMVSRTLKKLSSGLKKLGSGLQCRLAGLKKFSRGLKKLASGLKMLSRGLRSCRPRRRSCRACRRRCRGGRISFRAG